jgi:AcrR family transcriptional regulator
MPADRRSEILDAAGECFARYGYDKATMDDIGSIVGMNKVSIYYYFQSKEALFKETLKREAEGYLEVMRREAGKAPGCRERIRCWVAQSFRFGSGSAVLRQVSVETLRKLSPLLEEFREWSRATSVDFVAKTLEAGRKSGEIKDCDTGKVAESIVMFITAVKDMANRQFAAGGDPGPETERAAKRLRFAIDLILDGLEAKSVPKRN